MSAASRSEALLGRLETFGVRLGLERIRAILAALGDPQTDVPTVLIAGTNGKGSTAALLDAMSRAAGYRTGLYTSPHLEDVRERIRLEGRAIDDPTLAGYLDRCLEAARRAGTEPPTYFEAMTAAAWCRFRDGGAQLAVMEVGLGGRLDATNIGNPALTVISEIGLDHERHLGSTRTAIAVEKSGILRPGVPAIAWADGEVEAVLEVRARKLGVRLMSARRVVEIKPRSSPAAPQLVQLKTPGGGHELELALAGRHQLRNLALAVLAAEVLAQTGWPALDRRAIRHGAAVVQWPGRLEWVTLPGRRLLLDAAHNLDGLAALTAYVETLDKPVDLLFGTLDERRLEAALSRLARYARHVVLTRPPSDRAAAPETFRDAASASGADVTVEPDSRQALDVALRSRTGRTLVVSGSLYLIGGVRRALRERFGTPPPMIDL